MTTQKQVVLETTKATISKERYTMFIDSQGHTIIGDEPLSAGGADLGMNPFSLLLAGLGSCTASTIKMFADRKNWPLERATVNVIMSRVLEAAADHIEITKEIMLDGQLSGFQREKLLEVAEHCPVHKILSSPVELHTILTAGKAPANEIV